MFNGAQVGHLVAFVNTVDTHNSDIGIYSLAGALIGDIGPQVLSVTNISYPFVQGTVTLPNGPGYFCFTSATSTTLVLDSWAASSSMSFFFTGTVSGATTTGGQLLSSITPPANVLRDEVTVPTILLLP
jgi:hypothetical protein